jgi:hypothetical protein
MTDRELLSEIQYALIEPPDGGDTWPSLIWTRAEVIDALNAGIRALARDAHLDVARVEIPVAAMSYPIDLPCDWLATAAAVWRSTGNIRTPLGPVDRFEADLAIPGFEGDTGGGTPLGYLDRSQTRLTIMLAPYPSQPGTLELLYIRVPPPATGALPGARLPIADEFLAGIKYATLASLLRKVGRLLDDERAAYCERRYELTQTATDIILGGWG